MEDPSTPKAPLCANCRHHCSSCGSGSRRRSFQDEEEALDQLTKKHKRLFPEENDTKILLPVSQSPLPNIVTGIPSFAVTPPSGTKPATSLRRSISEPASQIEWLIKLKDRMNEIAQIWDEIPKSELICEEQEISQPVNEIEDGCKAIPTKDENNCEEHDDSVESVTVERSGKFFNIHFKCSCGKGYQFMLSEGSCFYKLM